MIERWRRQPHQEGYESKIDAVVRRLPEYRQLEKMRVADPRFDPNGVSTMITPSVSDMHQAFLDMQRGLISSKPVMFANVPSYHDPTMRGDSGVETHVFSLEALFTPYGYVGGWDGSDQPSRWLDMHDTLLDEGLRHDMGPWRAMTPDKYESEFHLPAGHATSFAGGPLAAFRGKPEELTRYRTPIKGLYLCGAATFPGAGIWGASGRHCAREILGQS
jgi:phytoene dehydrogenase-like protein